MLLAKLQKMSLLQKLLVLTVVTLLWVVLRQGTTLAAPLGSNIFPNPASSDPNFPLYMTIGRGEFSADWVGAIIMADSPGQVGIIVEEAAFCNDDSRYAYNSLDLPRSSNHSQPYFDTRFNVLSLNGSFQTGAVLASANTGWGRDCSNRNIGMTINLTERGYNGKYMAVFLANVGALNPNYSSAPGAAENSFRIILGGGNNPLTYPIPSQVLSRFFNFSNRNRPTNNYAYYNVDLRIPCSVGGPTQAYMQFFDADNGTYQNANGYPPLTVGLADSSGARTPLYTYYPGPVPIPNPVVVTGGNGQPSAIGYADLAPNTSYQFSFNGLSWINAITYQFSLDPYVLFASDACVAPSCSITSIYNINNGSTTIYPGERIAFNVNLSNAGGHLLGVNGPAWGNPGAWGNYLVAGNQYVRTPIPADGNFVPTLFGYSDSGPWDQAFIAPGAPGVYQFNWGLVVPGVAWAGSCSATLNVAQPPPPDRAQCVGAYISSGPVVRGRPFSAVISFRNSGTTTWQPGAWNLGSVVGGTNNYLTNGGGEIRGATVPGAIPPGAIANMTVNYNAPNAAGTFPLYWLMVHEGVAWFGDSQCGLDLTIVDPPDSIPSVTFGQNCSPPFTITIIVTDPDGASNGLQPQINYSVNGVAASSVRTVGNGTVRSYVFNMPSNGTVSTIVDANSYGVNPNPPGGDGSLLASRSRRFDPCSFTFTLSSQPQPPTLDDSEVPTFATFSAPIGFSGGAPRVNGVSTNRIFFHNRGGNYSPSAGTITGGVTTALGSGISSSPDVTTKPSDAVLGNVTRGSLPSPMVAGDMICVSLTVSPGSGLVSASGNIFSGYNGAASVRTQCETILNRPYIRAYGGDVHAGSTFGANCAAGPDASLIAFSRQGAGGWVGSGSELGVFSGNNGSIRGFTSKNVANPNDPRALAFSRNSLTSTAIFGGNFGGNFCSDDYWASKLPTLTNSPNVTLDVMAAVSSANNGQYQIAGGQTITAPQALSSRLALYVDGDVTISGTGIRTSTAWTARENMASMYLVVRGNIYIDATVTQLDGIYVAMPTTASPTTTGRIYTCATNAAPTNAFLANSCNNKLIVNGALVAQRVNFLRTGGTLRTATLSETYDNANIAEVIRYTPEMFITLPAISTKQTKGTFDSVVSLPPSL